MLNEQERQLKNLDTPIFRRRDVLAMTGLDRGLMMGWEKLGLWEYKGPKEGHRLYSILDVRRFLMARELMAPPMEMRPAAAWRLINSDPALLLDSGPAYLLLRRSCPLPGSFPHESKVYRLDSPADVAEVVAGVAQGCSQIAVVNIAVIRLAAWAAMQQHKTDLDETTEEGE